MALLRSYAVPEVYGPSTPAEGGLYRIWRQVDLHIAQGRHFSGSRVVTTSSSPTEQAREGAETDAVDLDLYCEVFISRQLCARTVVKRSLGSPEWHERFVFPDLPQFEDLLVIVWQEKRAVKPTLVGTVDISLTNFRRGSPVDGWFPVLHGTSGVMTPLQVGQLRLKVQVQEEVVLPRAAYSRVLDVSEGCISLCCTVLIKHRRFWMDETISTGWSTLRRNLALNKSRVHSPLSPWHAICY